MTIEGLNWNNKRHKLRKYNNNKNSITKIGQNEDIFKWTANLNLKLWKKNNLLQITEVFPGKGIHETVDPGKTLPWAKWEEGNLLWSTSW